jgi:hypothetical protein
MPAANEAEADVRILRASRKRKWLMALWLVLIAAGGTVAHVLTLPPKRSAHAPPGRRAAGGDGPRAAQP